MKNATKIKNLSICIVLLALSFEANQSVAQETAAQIVIELNRIEPINSTCKMTFHNTNKTDFDILKLAFEFVFFNNSGVVHKLASLDFQDLPASKSKIRQFILKDIKCNDLSRVLINDVKVCEGATLQACAKHLEIKNRTKIDFKY